MIKELENAKEILPLINSYMEYMSQFFEFKNYDDWLESQMKYMSLYGIESNRFIFALYESNKIIGFSLVNDYCRVNTSGCAIGEFYIEPESQYKGNGSKLASHIFNRFLGDWEVSVIKNNVGAIKFWQSLIMAFTKNQYHKQEIPNYSGYVFTFNNA